MALPFLWGGAQHKAAKKFKIHHRGVGGKKERRTEIKKKGKVLSGGGGATSSILALDRGRKISE